MSELGTFFSASASRVDAVMRRLLDDADIASPRLKDAVSWSLFGNGKRFRPLLVFAVARTLNVDEKQVERTAAAVEMIHAYSLIHDDLPAMDDDELRRGRETCHKRFDEASAILAGDTLHVLAFDAIANDTEVAVRHRLRLVSGLANAARKMVVGQQLDLDAEGKNLDISEIQTIHANKTGALITFAAMAPTIVADASDDAASEIAGFAEQLGLLFQISDDIIDITESTVTLGKTAAKDIASNKATYPSILGIEGSKELMMSVYHSALDALGSITPAKALLREIASFVVQRNS